MKIEKVSIKGSAFNKLGLPTEMRNKQGSLSISDGKLLIRKGDSWSPIKPATLGPGPQELIAGDMQAGFFGEMDAEGFISYDYLSRLCEVTQGSLQYNNESRWLKFASEGRILYIAKKTIRHSISWRHLNLKNVVYPGLDLTLSQTLKVRVRLMTGGNADPATGPGGEWDSLFVNIHTTAGKRWANYTDSDLLTRSGNGRITWCKESLGGNHRLRRATSGGILGTNGFAGRLNPDNVETASHSYDGWRPVLELLQ